MLHHVRDGGAAHQLAHLIDVLRGEVSAAKRVLQAVANLVFGQVIEGQAVVDKIGGLPTNPGDRPLQDAVMKRVYIELAK